MSKKVGSLISNVWSLCHADLTRPTVSVYQHKGVLFLPARLIRARKVSDQEKVSDARMQRSPLNFLLNGSLGSAFVFHMGLLFA